MAVLLMLFFKSSVALEPSIPLQVWVNQAIVNLFTYSYDNWDARQKDMASYFTPDAWQAFQNAINKSNIIAQVKQNKFTVSAVATLPPTIKNLGKNLYQVEMPILVAYKNTNDTQIQNLVIQIHVFNTNNSGFGQFAINQFLSKIDTAPCACKSGHEPKVTIV
jgi:hypothetical protein